MQARNLVSQDPKRVAQVVKTWVGEGNERGRAALGVDRAAILLLALGEQDAAQVLKHLGAKDVQRVGAAMAQLSGVSREEVSAVLATFSTKVEQQTSLRRRHR